MASLEPSTQEGPSFLLQLQDQKGGIRRKDKRSLEFYICTTYVFP